MQISLNLAIAVLIFSFLILPQIVMFALYSKPKALKICAIILFIIYLFAISLLVFGSTRISNEVLKFNIVQNAEWFSLRFCVASFGKREMLYNLIMMFPVSAFVFAITKEQRFCFKKTFFVTILVSLFISLCIEILQFILPFARTTELFDLLTNTISGVFGYCFFASSAYFFEHARQSQQNKELQ